MSETLPAPVAGEPLPAAVEAALMQGDLSKLSIPDRLSYYKRVCESLGLNPYTRPFDYLNLNGKLTLYAKRDAADQLRRLHGVSITKPDVRIEDDMVIVAVSARDREGREDSELGVVSIAGKRGEDRANGVLKAITKAKRRVTLSLCGLGWLDESEVDSIPGAQRVPEDAFEAPALPASGTGTPPPQARPAVSHAAVSHAGATGMQAAKLKADVPGCTCPGRYHNPKADCPANGAPVQATPEESVCLGCGDPLPPDYVRQCKATGREPLCEGCEEVAAGAEAGSDG